MKKTSYKGLVIYFSFLVVNPISCWGEEYWQQFVHYKIYARLNTENHTIVGYETLLYQNNSPDTLSELYFHLYPNAFQKNSIMAKEARRALIEIVNSPQEQGWIKIDTLTIIKLTPDRQPVKIEALFDDTILKIKITPHLYPGEHLRMFIEFTTKIRQFNYFGGKGGYRKDLYEISQWYPKICVYDQKGWNAIQYHWLGEFYGEFGIFDVTLNVPDSFIVAATGEVVSGDPGWEIVKIDSNSQRQHDLSSWHDHPGSTRSSRKIVIFHAEKVHDFVWVTGTDYLYQTDKWFGIPIHVLFRKASQKQWCNKALIYIKKSLEWLNDLIGEYPYPQITVCEALTPGGMEYPMVAMLGNLDSTLLVHEIGHMYFYGAVANNEQAEGWLDEGLVTYQSQLFDDRFNSDQDENRAPSLNNLPFGKRIGSYHTRDIQLNSLYNYLYSGLETPLAVPCYQLNNKYHYSYHVYLKPSKFFAMLDYLVGHETFKKILYACFDQWKFKHINCRKFQAVCEQASGMDLNWFFDAWLHNTMRIDYALTDFITQQQKNGAWKTDFTIKRLGDGHIPIETEVITESGNNIRQRCHIEKQQARMTVYTTSKVKHIRLDPDDVSLDQNRLNNSRPELKIFFNPEFPGMYYLPRNAYSLFLWPKLWYNDIDGCKIGLNLLGSYLNRYYVTRNSLWYGFNSNKFDFYFSYSTPWEKLNKNIWRHFYISNIEGRQEINLNINYYKIKELGTNLFRTVRFGFSHQDVTDERYTFRSFNSNDRIIKIHDWDKGSLNKFYFSYQTNSRYRWLETNLEYTAEISHKAWYSDFNYIRFSLFHHFRIGSDQKNWKLNLKNFVGYSSSKNNHLPLQDRFWLAEGNPGQRFKYFYLRSTGSMPPWVPYHFPGDGNLRGYVDKLILGQSPLAANRLISVNFEFVHRNLHRVLPPKLQKQIQGIDFCVFFDAGGIWIKGLDQNCLFDAGIGLRIYKIILRKQRLLRIDYPFWLSHPELDKFSPAEPSWKFRWIVSFQ